MSSGGFHGDIVYFFDGWDFMFLDGGYWREICGERLKRLFIEEILFEAHISYTTVIF